MTAAPAQAELRRAWAAWVLNRRAYEIRVSGDYVRGAVAQNPKIWSSVLSRCAEQGCDPEAAIAAYFRDRPERIPHPQALMSPAVVRRCADLAAVAPDRCAAAWRGQDARLETALRLSGDGDGAILAAITDPTLQFSPLYRYCVASISGLPETALRFFDPATLLYATDRPAIDVAVGRLIPDALRARAAKLLGPPHDAAATNGGLR